MIAQDSVDESIRGSLREALIGHSLPGEVEGFGEQEQRNAAAFIAETAAERRSGQVEIRLESIGGNVPKLIDPPEGCRFAPRCKYAIPACVAATPALREVGVAHRAACIRAEEIETMGGDLPAAPARTVTSTQQVQP